MQPFTRGYPSVDTVHLLGLSAGFISPIMGSGPGAVMKASGFALKECAACFFYRWTSASNYLGYGSFRLCG